MVLSRRLLMATAFGGSFTVGTNLGWFNVQNYGAANDGSTDDTTAINAAIAAWNAAGFGVLYFPAGTGYKVTGALTTITASGTVLGDGMGTWSSTLGGPFELSSAIKLTSATAVLFTVTGGVAFRDISLVNTSGSASAGSAIKVSGTDYRQHCTLDSVFVASFYDCIDIQTNSVFAMNNCNVWNPTHYGLKLQNTVQNDAGGATIMGCAFISESQGASAGVYIASSGGNKFVNSTINNIGTHGIQLAAVAASSILLISNCSIENYTGDAIHLDAGGHAYDLVSIVGCEFGQYSNGTGHALYATGVNGLSISGCLFRADTGTPTAISLNSGARGYVGPMVNDGYGTLLATSSFTSLLDHSNS